MKLMELINLNDFKLFWKDTIEKVEYRNIMEQIGVQFWIKNSKRELRDLYTVIDIFKSSISSYVKINQQKFNYLIETAEDDFIGFETKRNSNSNARLSEESNEFNRDFYGGEGKVGKDTANNTTEQTNLSNYVRKDKKDKTNDFNDVTKNSLIKELENKLFETFFIDENITW